MKSLLHVIANRKQISLDHFGERLFDSSLKFLDLIEKFPFYTEIFSAHMTVGSKLTVDGFAEVIILDNGSRTEIEDLGDSIADLFFIDVSKPDIARKLGVHHSTIYDEIKRGQVEILNSDLTTRVVYSPEMSESRHILSMKNREQPLKIGKDHKLANWLVSTIGDKGYSPAAACSLMGKTPETTFSVTLCRQTVYKYIDKGYLWPLTNKQLRYKGKQKRNYNKVTRAARPSKGDSIERRPDIINERKEAGHWEMDSVQGKQRTKRALLVMTERVTRKELAFPMQDQTAASVVNTLDRLEKQYGSERFKTIFKSITVDNGHEFMDLEGMQRSYINNGSERTHIYYCHPRNPGERGSNEKQNQLIRWFFPKGTDFTHVSNDKIKKAIEWINNYPRLLLNWKTSNELYDRFLATVT